MEQYFSYFKPYMSVIAVCLRGCGYSSYNTPITGIRDLARDISLFAQEELKLEKMYVLGHSFGC